MEIRIGSDASGKICEKCGKYITQPLFWGGTFPPIMCDCPKTTHAMPGQSDNIQTAIKRTPHKCPICQGTGNVPGGFYNSVAGGVLLSDRTIERCRACKGEGIIFS